MRIIIEPVETIAILRLDITLVHHRRLHACSSSVPHSHNRCQMVLSLLIMGWLMGYRGVASDGQNLAALCLSTQPISHTSTCIKVQLRWSGTCEWKHEQNLGDWGSAPRCIHSCTGVIEAHLHSNWPLIFSLFTLGWKMLTHKRKQLRKSFKDHPVWPQTQVFFFFLIESLKSA